MGLKRMNPARTRLFTAPETATVANVAPAANTPEAASAKVKTSEKKAEVTAPAKAKLAETKTKLAATTPMPLPAKLVETNTKPAVTTPMPLPAKLAETNTKPAVTTPMPLPAKLAETKAEPAATTPMPLQAFRTSRSISMNERHKLIERTAYILAEKGGFRSDPIYNWLQAESQVDAELSRMMRAELDVAAA